MTTIDFYERFDQLSTILNSFAYSLTHDIDKARDLYQETAYRALKNSEKFKPDTNFKAWMMTIMKNIFINDYRRTARRKTILDASDNNFLINSGKEVTSNKGDTNIMMQELDSIINELDESLRVPFMMHFEGYKYQEIADKFKLPLGTLKSRIFFARKALQKRVRARYELV